MEGSFTQKARTFYRTLAVRIIVLTIIFLAVPIIFYRLFQIADNQQNELLLRTVQQKGSLIAAVLRPHLANFQDEPQGALERALDAVAAPDSKIKILVRPENAATANSFLYVASSPAVSADYLRQERDQLIKLGIFEKLAPTCDSATSPTLRFTNPAGDPEILTSVTPIHLGKSCWVVITTEEAQAILGTSIGQPAWRTPTMHVAALVYLLSAVIVAWLFVDLWRNLDRFRMAARKIRVQGPGEISFREMNTIPELNGVADDFDSLVRALKQSKDFIVQAAEENAHALKAPLAVIAQAIEPLKRETPMSSALMRRSIELIERAAARLDMLVSAARDLEQVAADVIAANSQRIDLSSCVSQLVAAYEATLTTEGKSLQWEIDRGVRCYATEEAIESIVENLLENAAGFAEPGGTVSVTLKASDGYAHLTVADDGPGVSPNRLPLIFERNYSTRALTGADITGAVDNHYGLGLWIVRRNVEALGGKVFACNGPNGGFAVTASFRATEGYSGGLSISEPQARLASSRVVQGEKYGSYS